MIKYPVYIRKETIPRILAGMGILLGAIVFSKLLANFLADLCMVYAQQIIGVF